MNMQTRLQRKLQNGRTKLEWFIEGLLKAGYFLQILDMEQCSKALMVYVLNLECFGNIINNFQFGFWRRTKLMAACLFGNYGRVQELLDHNTDVNAKGKLGNTALVEAVKGSNPEIIEIIRSRCSTYTGEYSRIDDMNVVVVEERQTGFFNCITCSFDDGRLAVASSDSSIRILNVLNGTVDHIFNGANSVSRLCVVSSNRIASIASSEKNVMIWDTETQTCFKVLEGHSCEIMFLSCISKSILSVDECRTMRLWHSETGICEKVLVDVCDGFPGRLVRVCVLSFDQIAWANNMNVGIWNCKSGERNHLLVGHEEFVNSIVELSFVRIATGARDIRIWNIVDGACERVLGGKMGVPVYSMCALPGNRCFSIGLQTLLMWNTSTGEGLGEIPALTNEVFHVLSDGRVVIRCRPGRYRTDSVLKIINPYKARCEIEIHESTYNLHPIIWICNLFDGRVVLCGTKKVVVM